MEEKSRDISKDKKKIKKGAKIIFLILCALTVLTLVLWGISSMLKNGETIDTLSAVSGIYFFPADYDENIFEDGAYMALDRSIQYNAYGETMTLVSDDENEFGKSGAFFYRYFQYIINGDADGYRSCFTDDGRKHIVIPEKFTMQKLYDINISLFKAEERETKNGVVKSEIYEVSYRIFENNGTFRGDISSMETKTLVYELYITGGDIGINAIGYRKNA